MTAQRPAERLVAVAATYWFALLAGLVMYTAIRLGGADAGRTLLPIWIGATAGTALGQLLAALRLRLWLAAVVIALMVALVGPALVHGFDSTGGHALWRAFLPAAACGYLCLGDRGALAAFWFPAMLWMLSILDRTGARPVLDRGGIVLLGGLALLFVLFLRMRESRRLALWTTVATAPLATARKVTVLAEHPGGELGRTTWSVLALAGALAATSWAAPLLWQRESLRRPPPMIASATPPCCPLSRPAPVSRWSEYLDIGRTDDDPAPAYEWQACRPCGSERGLVVDDLGVPVDLGIADLEPVAGNQVDGPGDGAGGPGIESPTSAPSPTMAPAPAPTPPRVADPGTVAPRPARPPIAPPPTARPPVVSPPPVAPPPVAALPPPVAAPPPPVAAPPPPPLAARAADAPPPDRDPQTQAAPRPGDGASILRGVALLLGALLLLRAITLALRPLRRLIVLRHLREPWWPETVDQRVSNSWQLVLIGLRDAGWRWTAAESPQELARRVAADGTAACASILDRARHGLGVDAEDLVAMRAAADAAYRSARAPLGLAARIAAQLRSPLT